MFLKRYFYSFFSVESSIPYYVGKIIDGLSGDYKHDTFLWAIACMSFYSFGR